MDKEVIRNIFTAVVAAGTGILAGWLCRGLKPPQAEPVTITDTLYMRDTNIYRFPDMVTEITIPEETIVLRDSLIIVSDSICILPVQQKYYKGAEYEVWVSGYKPQLDSCRVFPETKFVTKTVQDMRKTTRWGIGIQAGYGMSTANGKPTFTPYIGVGISYNLIRF